MRMNAGTSFPSIIFCTAYTLSKWAIYQMMRLEKQQRTIFFMFVFWIHVRCHCRFHSFSCRIFMQGALFFSLPLLFTDFHFDSSDIDITWHLHNESLFRYSNLKDCLAQIYNITANQASKHLHAALSCCAAIWLFEFDATSAICCDHCLGFISKRLQF